LWLARGYTPGFDQLKLGLGCHAAAAAAGEDEASEDPIGCLRAACVSVARTEHGSAPSVLAAHGIRTAGNARCGI
jgi:hypothetical protein